MGYATEFPGLAPAVPGEAKWPYWVMIPPAAEGMPVDSGRRLHKGQSPTQQGREARTWLRNEEAAFETMGKQSGLTAAQRLCCTEAPTHCKIVGLTTSEAPRHTNLN
jgi:hypothetical protein